MNQPDPYGDWDAAYVLGALTVQQRHEYEDHLAGCADCRQSVGDLAAMPGLLAQLPAAEAIALSDHAAASDGAQLPASIRDLTPPRRTSTRARLLLVAAVIVALIMGGIGGFLVRGAVLPRSPDGGSSVLVAFAPNHPTDMIANARLTSSGSRTRIHVDCMYAVNGPYAHSASYALETVDDQGNRQRSWVWSAGPGDHESWNGWAAVPIGQIRSLQIVYADGGAPLMTAAVR